MAFKNRKESGEEDLGGGCRCSVTFNVCGTVHITTIY